MPARSDRMFLPLTAVLLATGAPDPQLTEIHSVYLLPMSGNLDQFLAVRLNASKIRSDVSSSNRGPARDGRSGPSIDGDSLGLPAADVRQSGPVSRGTFECQQDQIGCFFL